MSALVRIVPLLVFAQIAFALLHWRRCRKEKRPAPRALLVLTAAFFLATWPPVAWLTHIVIEAGHELDARPRGNAQAIVVLSGAVHPPRSHRPVLVLARDTYMRCRHAAWLHKSWRQLPVLVSGGRISGKVEEGTLADAMADYLELEGIPSESIWKEERSATTYENALHSAEFLEKKGITRIALVTDAYHMPRAARCFRAQGLEVIEAPGGIRAGDFRFDLKLFIPSYHALAWHERVVHEWIGSAWYWVRGRI